MDDPCDQWLKKARDYLDRAGLLAALVGAGLTLTGLVKVWIGFSLLLFALAVLAYDILGVKRFNLSHGSRWSLAGCSVGLVLLLLWHPMIEYAKAKDEHPVTMEELRIALTQVLGPSTGLGHLHFGHWGRMRGWSMS